LPKRPQFISPAVPTSWPTGLLTNNCVVEPSADVDDPVDDETLEPETFEAGAAAKVSVRVNVPDTKLICAAGATERITLAAVAGIRNARARKAVKTTVGIKSSFFTGSLPCYSSQKVFAS
jgi:hypothetical protein